MSVLRRDGTPRALGQYGSLYPDDRKERYRQLVADGKIGGSVARLHGSMVGRPRNRPQVDLAPADREMLLAAGLEDAVARARVARRAGTGELQEADPGGQDTGDDGLATPRPGPIRPAGAG